MDILQILNDKILKGKEKTDTLANLLLSKQIDMNDLLELASGAKDSPKATCIEAIEFVTKVNPKIANLECLDFVSETLTAKAPRVKWESAKVIGNIAHLFPNHLDKAITNLLKNTEHEGTVVRWSAAYALSEIIKINQTHAKNILPSIHSICDREEKNSIKKIYLAAIKKLSV